MSEEWESDRKALKRALEVMEERATADREQVYSYTHHVYILYRYACAPTCVYNIHVHVHGGESLHTTEDLQPTTPV